MQRATVMRVRERLLVQYPVLPGVIPASRFQVFLLLIPVSVTQCPGLIYSKKREQPKCIIKLIPLLFPLKEKGIVNIEERGVREREKIRVSHLFIMRAGPISAH